MVDSWNNNPNVYLKLKDHLDENINLKFINLDKKFKKKVTVINKGSSGNKTLYAKWKKK